MTTNETTQKVSKTKIIIGVIVVLIILILLFLLPRQDPIDIAGLAVTVTETLDPLDGGSVGLDLNPVGSGIMPSDSVANGSEEYPIPEIANPTFDSPKWFDSNAGDPVSATMTGAIRLENGTVMYTFQADEALIDQAYTVNIGLPSGATVNYQCGFSEKYPDKVNCFGPGLTPGIELTAVLYAGDPNYSIANFVKPSLLNAKANALDIDWSTYNKAAESMGIKGTVDNPFIAWEVIGCCVMNSATGEIPAGCEEVSVGDDTIPDFLGLDKAPNQGAADFIWDQLMEDANKPPSDPPPSAYTGGLIDEDALLGSANACAAAMGMEGDFGSVREARAFFDMVNPLDPRDHGGGSWGAALADGITGWADNMLGFFELFYSTEPWEQLGEGAWDLFNMIFTDSGKALACAAMQGGEALGINDLPDWCLNDDGTVNTYDDIDTDNVDPGDIMAPFVFPAECEAYVDYSRENTYFAMTNAPGAFGFGILGEYCMDELGMTTNSTAYAYASNYSNELYDALIEGYEYTGNPAMPDSCQAFADLCNSDQTNPDNPMVYTEGSMMITNGCNDPTTFAEKENWTDDSEAPDCSFLEGDGTMTAMLINTYKTNSNYVENTHCYQVWNQAAVSENEFRASVPGQVLTCAQGLGYNQPMETVEDYMDFMTFIGALDNALDIALVASFEGCDAALDWAYWLGLTNQGIVTAGTSCDEGGPAQASTLITFTNPETVIAGEDKDERHEDEVPEEERGKAVSCSSYGSKNSCEAAACSWEYVNILADYACR